MTTTIKAGSIVEVVESGRSKGQFAVVVEKPADAYFDHDVEPRVWVRYDNGCVAPVREHWVYEFTADELAAKLNANR